ncbi:MAG TPA: hypothetical protein VMM78_18480 [Thermomicrobiales bacterium]|nr:hypothetical protein [Thermomicrobiales bacterium]
MNTTIRTLAAALAVPFALASAQQQVASVDHACCKTKADSVAHASHATKAGLDSAAGAVALWSLLPPIQMQNFRPADQRGVNVFESPKESGIPFTGFRISWGAAFRQQFQGLEHKNTATPVMSGSTNVNQLIDIGRGFNLADANLSLNMQVADGIRVHLSTYLSSKHHQDAWVKDGYFLMDKSPIDHPLLNTIMKYTTVKMGHYETNFGDQHFRRSDNGNGMHNAFVGNLIIDAFTTEVGGEAYFRNKGIIAMAGLNSGTINGGVTAPDRRSNAYLGKLGYDKQLTGDLRLRLMGSYYKNDKSTSNTLLTGDRAGHGYDLVMENTAASLTSQAWSGQMRSMGFSNTIRAYAVNPFVKWNGVEFFGTYDNFKGKSLSEPSWRSWTQQAGEVIYRFWDEKMFVGGRGNTAKGALLNTAAITYTGDVSIDRNALSAGWFVTPALLMKGEYMQQKYHRFPARDIRSGGKIQGFVVEGVVSF